MAPFGAVPLQVQGSLGSLHHARGDTSEATDRDRAPDTTEAPLSLVRVARSMSILLPSTPVASTTEDHDEVRAGRLAMLITRLAAQQMSGRIGYWAACRR